MAFETLKASLYALLSEVAEQPEDLHEMQETLRERLAEMRGLGQPLPQDLVNLEAYLEDVLERPERHDRHRAVQVLTPFSGKAQRTPGRRHPPPHSEKG